MAITVDLVKKLILEYIGGKPLFGNPGNVWAGKHLVAIQIPHLGALGSLTGALGQLVNEAGSALSAVQSLVQNPLGALTGEVSSLAGNVLSQVQGISGLPGAALSQVTGAVSTLQTSAQGLLDHTNILSGVVQDAETIGTNALSAGELMKVTDPSDVMQLAGALFSDGQVDSIRQSLDPNVPGGVTDTLNLLLASTDPTEQTNLADNLSKQLTDHATALDTIVTTDQAATNQYILTRDITTGTHDLFPDTTNDAQNMLFDRIATPTLKQIFAEYPDDVRNENSGDLVLSDAGSGTISITTAASRTQVPPHTHPTSDIISLLTFIQQAIQTNTFTANTAGSVPASGGANNKFLCANGSWSTVSSNGTIVTANSSAVPDRSTLATSNTAVGALYLYESGREGEFVWDNSNLSTLVTADPSQGIYVAPTSDTTGASGAWVRKFTGKADARWWGLVDNGAGASNTTALINAIAALKALEQTTTSGFSQSSPGLYIPKGTYSGLTSALVITHELHIEGDDTGAPGGGGSVLKWVAGVHGFDCQSPCKITKLSLYGGYTGTAGEFHGIKVRSPITVEDCYIDSFQGNGIDMNATSVANGGTGETAGIANGTYVRRVFIQHCKSGIYAAGSDSSACSFSQTRVFFNREYGINDESFLGNTYLQPESVGNTLSSYRTNGASQKSLFLNPYSELGQPAAIFDQRTLILGGLLSNGYTGAGAWIDTQLGIAEAFRGIVGICPDRTSSWQIGHNVSGYFGNMGSTTIQASANTTGGNYWWRGGLGGIYQRLNDSDFAFVQGWTDASDTNWHTFGFPRMYLGLGNPANGPSLAKILVRAMSSAPSDNQGQGAFTFNQAFTGAGSSPIAWIKDTVSPTSYTPIYSGTAVQAATRTALSQLDTSIAEAYLYESGREGTFVWDSSNLSSFVTADTQKGIYVAPASDTTGASGAWVRKGEIALQPEWFGAKGDGVTDDSAALGALSAYVNAIGGGLITFSANAVYIVGNQTLHTGNQASGYSFPPDVLYPLEFNSCTKPVILRGNGATIKAKVGAKYGTFNDDGTSKGTVAPYTGGGLATPYQAMVYAHDCSALVSIENLILDGNMASLTLGGQYGDTGWQIPCVGLQTSNNTAGVFIENVTSHHHALDGAEFDGPTTSDTGQREESVVIGLKTYCNARQGVSFIGGKGWTFRDCSFNWTGKANPGSDTAAVFSSNPGAGVDLEATAGKIIRDLSFEDCELIGNKGAGLLSDGTDVDRVRVARCTIIGTTNFSLWPKTPRFLFEKCLIMGCMVDVYGNTDYRLATQFKQCHLLYAPTQSPTGALFVSGGVGNVAKFHDPGSSGSNIRLDECILEWNAAADGVGSQTTFGWWHNCTVKANVAGYVQAFGSFSGRNTTFTNSTSIPRQDIATANGWNYAGASYDRFTFNGTVYDPDQDLKTFGGISVGGITVIDSTHMLQAAAFPALTGDITTSAGSLATTIGNAKVTLPKIQNATANSKLLGSGASGSGASYSELSLGTGLTMTGTTLDTNVQLVSQSAAASSHTGDLTETTLATITLPAGAMGANGKVEIQARWSFSGTAGTKTPRIKFGGTAIIASNVGATITAYRHNSEVANRNATNSQYTFVDGMNSSAASLMTTGTLAIDTTASVSITITGTLANAADTITLESYQVLLYPHS